MQDKPDLRIAVLVGVTLAFLIAIGNLYWQLEHTRTELAGLRQSILSEVTKVTQAAATQLATSSKRAPAGAAEPSSKILDSLKQQLADELTSTRRQATAAAMHAKAEAVSHADKLAERIGEERLSQQKEVVGELGQIKDTAATTTAKIKDV